MAIGDRIRNVRLNRNLKQSELADKACVSRVSIGFYERGERIPPADVAARIAKVLDIPVEYLLLGTLSKESLSDDDRFDRAFSTLELAGFKVEAKTDGYHITSNEFNTSSLVGEDELLRRVEDVLMSAEAHKENYIKKRLSVEFDENYKEEIEDWYDEDLAKEHHRSD